MKVHLHAILSAKGWLPGNGGNQPVAVNFEAVRRMALSLEGVEEATSYGTPAFKVRGALMTRLHQSLDALVLRTDFEQRAELMAADPETYFITDHYLNYEWVLVNLKRVRADAMRDLLRMAWRAAAAEKPKQKSKTGRRSRG
jgi:hypothetical protein